MRYEAIQQPKDTDFKRLSEFHRAQSCGLSEAVVCRTLQKVEDTLPAARSLRSCGWMSANSRLSVEKNPVSSRIGQCRISRFLETSEEWPDFKILIKLNDIANQCHLPLVDYRQHGTDAYFSIDQTAHTSRYGWVYVDQTLDEFFHGQIQP